MNDLSVFPFDGTTVKGPRRVAEGVLKRLITPRGGLLDVPNYGSDLRAYLGIPWSERLRFEIARVTRTEALKEPEVLDAEVSVSFAAQRLKVRVTLLISNTRLELALNVTPEQVTADLYDPIPKLGGLYA